MYTAIITKITVSKHPNADRLQIGTTMIGGVQVVVGNDTKTGDLGILFPEDGQLSEEMATANDLVARKDEHGNRAGGFFSENRRVRAQKFRGVKSEGYWTPLTALEWTGYDLSKLVEGEQLTELNGHSLCNRYETKATRMAGLANKQRSQKRGETIFFRKHFDTPQLRFIKDTIFKNGGIVYITEKLHGTSRRFGYVLDTPKPKWWQKGWLKPKPQYRHMLGTRNVIVNDNDNGGFYGTNGFREQVVEGLQGKLHKGETLYFEVVGDVAPGSPIMPPVSISDKELKKQYGDVMHYRYGIREPGKADIYIYRITMTNEDGIVTELSWEQVKKRCGELSVNYTPELQMIPVYDGHPEYDMNTIQFIEDRISAHVEGPSVLDATHIREGVVVRVESPAGTVWAKEKSFTFKVLEGIVKDNAMVVDLEEAS